jgi:hypothetical protein
VLLERCADGVTAGTSEDYLHVTVRPVEGEGAPRAGDVVTVLVTRAEGGSAWGSLVEC